MQYFFLHFYASWMKIFDTGSETSILIARNFDIVHKLLFWSELSFHEVTVNLAFQFSLQFWYILFWISFFVYDWTLPLLIESDAQSVVIMLL